MAREQSTCAGEPPRLLLSFDDSRFLIFPTSGYKASLQTSIKFSPILSNDTHLDDSEVEKSSLDPDPSSAPEASL